MSRDDKSVSHEVQLNYAFLNSLSYKMASYVNVLGSGVLDIIVAKSNDTAIVTIQGNLIEDKAVVWFASSENIRDSDHTTIKRGSSGQLESLRGPRLV
ncbi:hypothetical protein Tco_1142622 [Tanacetum coccineum]